MSVHFAENTTILTVERAGRIDRYGKSQMDTVRTSIGVNFKKSTRFVRSTDGAQVQIDGQMISNEELETKDILTIDNKNLDKYEIFSMSETLNPVTGDSEFFNYNLVRKAT